MTLLTVTECLDSGEKVYRAKTTLTARTTIKTEAAHWILESSIWGSKNCTVFCFFFFCIYHNAVVKRLLCVCNSVALEKYRDVLGLPELSLARETESCYVYWYRSVVISLPPPPPQYIWRYHEMYSGHHTWKRCHWQPALQARDATQHPIVARTAPTTVIQPGTPAVPQLRNPDLISTHWNVRSWSIGLLWLLFLYLQCPAKSLDHFSWLTCLTVTWMNE